MSSLLFADVKFLAKVLAKCLESVLPTILATDQKGFVSDQHNDRQLFDILHSPTTSNTPELVISMDTEKAFEHTEWSYLFCTLARFGLGKTFTSWIRAHFLLDVRF